MYSKDKGDGLSKEGAGRVAFYKLTKINLCYTLECNYNMGLYTNKMANRSSNFNYEGIYSFIIQNLILFFFRQ